MESATPQHKEQFLSDAADERRMRMRHDLGQAMLSGAMAGVSFGTAIVGAWIAKNGDMVDGSALATLGTGAGIAFAADMKSELNEFSHQAQQRTEFQAALQQIKS